MVRCGLFFLLLLLELYLAISSLSLFRIILRVCRHHQNQWKAAERYLDGKITILVHNLGFETTCIDKSIRSPFTHKYYNIVTKKEENFHTQMMYCNVSFVV